MKVLFFLTIILYISFQLVQAGNQHRSVLLEDVKTLTLHKGQKTEARRVSSIPQIRCVGGSAKCAYEPDVVQCYNRGSDGVDIQWECTSEMPGKYKFGTISVSCEGYNYPEDPNILAGSCGLEYNLDLTDKNYYDSTKSSNVRQSSTSKFWPFLFKVALIVTVFFVAKSFMAGNRTGGATPMSTGPDHRPPGGGGGGGWFSNFFPGGNGRPGGFGGGAGGFGNFFGGAPGQGDTRRGQPPPPGFRNDYTDNGADCNANRQQGGGAGNFLSGAALGALGGYVFGARNRQPNTQYMPGTANTGWFGGGGTTTDTHRDSPSSSSTHTSTSYGGTTRR